MAFTFTFSSCHFSGSLGPVVALDARRAWGALLVAAAATLTGGCADQPAAPVVEAEPRLVSRPAADAGAPQRQADLLAAVGATPASKPVVSTVSRLNALMPADVLLIGEQHDARQHQQIEQEIVALLAGRARLAALALEMADAGASTAQLAPSATPEQVRSALQWDDKGWSWPAYEPAVMTAVRAGVLVLGANLPRSQMPANMKNRELDARLPATALKAQQQAIRVGHCHLLPEKQIIPMTRLQIAKDITMAATLAKVVFPGKVVLLLTGKGHADRSLGVPQHLPGTLKVRAVGLQAGSAPELVQAFDSIWTTPALPEKDYCAQLQAQWPASGK